jgi:crotonobetainyl-CoA:carnitine CoA-transferase CaiB-like acyl-CoA transferase
VVERAEPLLGEHTEEILVNDLGYTPQHVAELHERKIIRTR